MSQAVKYGVTLIAGAAAWATVAVTELGSMVEGIVAGIIVVLAGLFIPSAREGGS